MYVHIDARLHGSQLDQLGICIRMEICIGIYTNVQMYVYVCTYRCSSAWIAIRSARSIYVCIYIYMYVHIYTRMYKCIYMYVQTDARLHGSPIRSARSICVCTYI